MATQFGSGAGGSSDNFSNQVDDGACRADDLRSLIERIASQVAESDERQTAALERMLARVETLGAEARSYKKKVPAEFLAAFESIESGVNMLADRISSAHREEQPQTAPARSAPAAATRAMSIFAETAAVADDAATEQPLQQTVPVTVATSNLAQLAHSADSEDSVIANDESTWDQQAADALAAHYERALGPVAQMEPEPHVELAHAEQEGLALLHAAHTHSPAPARDIRTGLLDTEREWLDGRFVDIARKVEDVLGHNNSDDALVALANRFDQLEDRFAEAISHVATRTDLDGLQQFEAHLADLTAQFDDARAQFTRLDGIEHALSTVMDRLADPRLDDALDRAGNPQDLEPLISAAVEQISSRINIPQPAPAPLPDFARLANAAAENVASRFADIARPESGNGDNLDAIRQLIDQFINERREGDEQTAAMLDTMQRAMIRVLDRVDALETSHAKSAPQEYVREHVRFGADSDVGASAQRAAEAASAMAARAQSGYETDRYSSIGHDVEDGRSEDAARPFGASTQQASRNTSAAESRTAGNPPASIERLRQDFIADARRAKMKAEQNAPAPAEGNGAASRVAVTDPAPAPMTMPKPQLKATEPAAAASKSIASQLRKPSRKLLVSAIVLMIAIPGALMILKKRAPAPAPIALEQVDPAIQRAAGETAPVVETQSEVAPTLATPERPASTGEQAPAQQQQPAEAPKSSPSSNLEPAPAAPDQDTRAPDKSSENDPRLLNRSTLPANPISSNAPPAGITVARPARNPTLAQLARLEERRATAQLSDQLGAAQVQSVPPAMIPSFMRANATADAPAEVAAQPSLSDNRRQPLNLPPATVGPLSLRLAAAKGDPSAEFEVGARFAEGKGTTQDLDEALSWYQRSASRGFAQAQYRVATFYERGLSVKQDNARAKNWYLRAAEQGNVKAMHNLAVLSAGKTAAVPDYAAAAKWFQTAADHGLADSQFNLAVLYESGLGVTKDEKTAYKWLALAARQGDQEAKKRRDELAAAMKPADLEAAKTTVANWRVKQADRIANDPIAAGEAWKSRAVAGGEI
ncbi:MAG: SEL1-like repeat protein [Hyphomicrobiaceae bacterium]|nr:SEL1-like repeat protein [Hyphomicrobiaceae bacterium]